MTYADQGLSLDQKNDGFIVLLLPLHLPDLQGSTLQDIIIPDGDPDCQPPDR
jgi:hypothetical protein